MRRARGFTLLEVLVALAILGIALGALLKAGASNTANAVYLRDKTLAHWVAMNRVAELQLSAEWPAVGTSKGKAEMGGPSDKPLQWYWTAKVVETPDPNVRRLDVEVRADEDSEASLDTLSAFLPRK